MRENKYLEGCDVSEDEALILEIRKGEYNDGDRDTVEEDGSFQRDVLERDNHGHQKHREEMSEETWRIGGKSGPSEAEDP